MHRLVAAVAFSWACALTSAAVGASPGLVAVQPTSPWTLRDLERTHADIASYDAETGIAYVVADAAEQARLAAAGFAFATVTPNLDVPPPSDRGRADLGLYHTYAETVAELESLATRFPALCTLTSIGRTFEGRDIPLLKISDDPQVDDAAEPDILLVGCHHAREFMSVEVPLFVARTLLEGYGIAPQLTRLVNERETWIVPLLNADGHVFQEIDQLRANWRPPGWRKNRRPNFDGTIGVDLNRNYGYAWGSDDEGSSPAGNDETYRGSGPFSEFETQAIRRLAERQRFVLAVSYHSFGGLVLYPWGFTRAQVTDDHALFGTLADSMVVRNHYRGGNAFTGTIYVTNGEAGDYFYGEISPAKPQQTLAFTVELNSAAQGGFWPPDSLIAPTCASLLPLNLFVLEAAASPRRPVPPPPPLLAAHQDPADAQHIRLDWTQPLDADNPIDHYEVFEITFTAGVIRPAAGALAGNGRVLVAHDVPRPASGALALRLDTELEPLWDYVYVEARAPGEAWQTLPGDVTRDTSPTGRNEGNGITGALRGRVGHFRTAGVRGPRFDVGLRLAGDPASPRRVAARAALDVLATFHEERHVLDPLVHGTSYELHTTATGLLACGVTAIDADGQAADSDLLYFVIPTTAVEASDFVLSASAGRQVLQWHAQPAGTVRFTAWVRALRGGETVGSRDTEWARGDYQPAATCTVSTPGIQQLTWPTPEAEHAVLLQAESAGEIRLWGPWRTALTAGLELAPPAPNPCAAATSFAVRNPGARAALVEICTVDGRRVRLLWAGPLAAGTQQFRWDARDTGGRRVAAGVYVLRAAAGAQVRARRVVVLR